VNIILNISDYWSSTSFLGPACVVTPTNATQLSAIVKTLTATQTQFAFRGNGHMPISNAANIAAPGILISSTNLTQLALTTDKQYVSIAPGNRWNTVYKFLEPLGLSTIGGRLGVVGTSGFLLGGGVSFFGNEFGFASSNIRQFEVRTHSLFIVLEAVLTQAT
jgi:FAD/FMN-containing dehydrogenase